MEYTFKLNRLVGEAGDVADEEEEEAEDEHRLAIMRKLGSGKNLLFRLKYW